MSLLSMGTYNTLSFVRANLERNTDGFIPISKVKEVVNSPRLFDARIYGWVTNGDVPSVGDYYLSEMAALDYSGLKIYGIALDYWLRSTWRDSVVTPGSSPATSIFQIWSFSPKEINEEEMALALALSYTKGELLENPLIVISLNELLVPIGFYMD